MRARAIEAATVLWRTFGWRGLVQRVGFEARRRASAFRTEPLERTVRTARTPMPDAWPFRPDAARVRDTTDRGVALDRATRVRDGAHQAYRWSWQPRPTAPSDWLRSPQTGLVYDAATPWWRVPHYDARAGDIKEVWEPGRFAWAYDLARGWILSGDEGFARSLREGVSTFLRSSPPYRGPQWACGQETAIRAIAWLWAEGACTDATAFDESFHQELLQALAWSGERIADAFEYAQSQRNNHGLSEATGLIAIGARLRAADGRAMSWIDDGHRALERMVIDQIAPDGWYIQHSFNYARVALDQLTTARRVLLSLGRDLSPRALERVRALIDVLGTCLDPASGQLPNHGANDGAYVLPLSTGHYRDFRPSLTAAAASFDTALPSGVEPNGETLAWLRAAPPPQQAARTAPWVRSGASGWAAGATSQARIFVRAGEYRSRPGHIDPGHVDLTIGGRPVAIDPGTFRYVGPPPWNNGLAAIDVHNTVSIDGMAAARRGPRFLWLAWPRATVEGATVVGDEVSIQIANDSWRDHGVVHRRWCRVWANGALIVDEISGDPSFAAPVSVQWLLEDDGAVEMEASAPAMVSETRGDRESTRGWTSDSYGTKRAVRSVRLTAVPRGGTIRISSAFGSARGSGAAHAAVTPNAEVSCST